MSQPRLSLAASAASRWTVCTASPHFIRENWHRIPPQDTSYSLEGQIAHAVCEALLLGKPLPDNADEAMVEHGRAYVDYCNKLAGPTAMVFVEQKVPLWYYPERNAIIDFAAVTADGRIVVIDYKYGAGVEVETEGNKQMAIYARCLIEDMLANNPLFDVQGDTPITMSIFQPRTAGEPTTWELTWQELLKWTLFEISAPAFAILESDSPEPFLEFVPSDSTCQFCPAASFCTARARHLLGDLAPVDLVLSSPDAVLEAPATAVALAPPEALDEKHLLAALAVAKQVKKWLTDIEEYATEMAGAGKPLPGFKLVEGRGSRQWGDPDAAAKLLKPKLKDKTFERKLISVAQAEKELKNATVSPKFKKRLDSLIVRSQGKPVLAPESDKRPALPCGQSLLTEAFADLSTATGNDCQPAGETQEPKNQ